MKVLQKPERAELHQIENTSWPEFKTICEAVFSIEHIDTDILITFDVKNDYFKSKQRPINDAVHKDNCVEFFIQFDNEENYYNVEFNCLGIGKVAYGCNRDNRTLLPASIINKISTSRDLHLSKEYFNWKIGLSIPVEVFIFSGIRTLKGLKCRGNFYKCGDDLPNPHYLSWSKISAATPDFHLPEFFGNIDFV